MTFISTIRRTTILAAAIVACSGWSHARQALADDSLIQSIDVSTLPAKADKDTYWMQARPGIVPGAKGDKPKTVVTLQKTDRVGTHMYHGLEAMWSSDLGKNWTGPEPIKSVNRIDHKNGLLEAPVDMTPQWHAKSGKLLATGATFWQDLKTRKNIPRGPSETAYTVYDPKTQEWGQWQRLKMPDDPKFHFARAGCTQRVDLPDGDILLPIYFYRKGPDETNYVTVARCSFDGDTLKYKEHGSELTVDINAKRARTGLYEPSLTQFNGKYYLTLRADEGAYVSVSDDGLSYSEPKPWKFDDGELLGSYNTQQHWVTHTDGLFLSYTRRGANNDKIMRHRAPVFIARVDPERLVVERATEQVVLPNLGAAFGNFGVCDVSPHETWIVDCLVRAKAGNENVYLAKIRWAKPNLRFEEPTSPAKAADDSAAIQSTPVWTAGQDGYHTYRIPSLITTQAGTLLAFCEGRVNSRSDTGKIHVLLRRSTDGGKTWSPQQIVWSDGDNCCGNPCPVVDQETGTIWLPLTHNIGSDGEKNIVSNTGKGTRTVWMTHSDDDGQTWAAPSEITSVAKKPEWSWYATGPGVGIQLQQGNHRGRMVIPCDYKAGNPTGFYSHVIYSDDHGNSWKLGGTVPTPICNECQVVELTDGGLMLNCRNHRGPSEPPSDGKYRQISLSSDGGTSWNAAKADPALPEPICQASLIRCFLSTDKSHPWLLFSNPAHLKKRQVLTVRLSQDDGKTWSHSKVIYPGQASYSCLAMLPSGEAACLYECDNSGKISLAKFKLDWLASE